MIEFRRKFISSASILLGMLWVTEAIAVGYVPLSLDGNISYSYGFASANNTESESTSIVVGIEMSGYIWQPWFVTNSWSLSYGTSKSTTGSIGGGSSDYITGRFSFNVFPQSRVPFSLSYSQGSSAFENDSTARKFTTNEFTTSRLLIRQSYVGKQGVYGNFIWSHVENDAGSRSNSSSDTLNLNLRKRAPEHVLSGNLGYSTNKSSVSGTVPKRTYLSVSHSYVPGTSVTLNSNLNVNDSRLRGDVKSDSTSIQAGTFFVWRPEYRSLSVSGGARLGSSSSSSQNNDESNTKSFGLNLGAAYQVSTRVRLNGNASAIINDDSTKQTSSVSENGTLSFSSEQYSLLGYNYSYGLGLSLSNSNNETSSGSTDSQSVSLGLNHRASRSWNVGRASNLNFGISQGGSIATEFDNDSEPTRNISHSLNVGISTRGRSGTTFVAISFSDTRSFSDVESEFQQLALTMSRTHTISRSSSFSATGSAQASTQSGSNVETKSIMNVRVAARYRNSRFLGVYGMPYSTNITYSRPIVDNEIGKEIIDWENRVEYSIGLLSTGMTVTARKNGNLDPTFTLFFRATRTF